MYISGSYLGTLDFGAAGSATSIAYGGSDGFLTSLEP
jgi:hypothetical protein